MPLPLALLLIFLLSFVMVACEQVKETTDVVRDIQANGFEARVSVDELAEWNMKVVDQVTYLRETTAGIVTQCIVVDASGQTLYSGEWLTIPEQDNLRVVQPTAAQIDECNTN